MRFALPSQNLTADEKILAVVDTTYVRHELQQ